MRNQTKSLSFRLRTLLILSLVFATFVNLTFTPYTTQAVPVGEMSPTEQAKSWLYFNAMASCVDQAGTTGSFLSNTMSVEGVNGGKWFNSGRENPSIGFAIGAMGVHVDGFPQDNSSERVECGGGNIEWIGDALKLWGYSNNLDAWCDMTGNLKRKDGSVCSGSSSSEGWDTTQATQALRSNFERVVRQKVYSGNEPARSDAARYAHAQAAFYGGCLRERAPSPYTGGESGDTVFKNVSVVNLSDGKVEKKSFAGVRKQSDSIAYSVSPAQNSISDTCAGLVAQMASYADAYSRAVLARIDAGKPGDTGGSSNCQEGAECTDETTSCAVEGVGWIICPITNFMAGMSDGAFSAIASFLTVNTDLYNNTDSSSGTYAAWSAFRNIANIAFAIVFIFIIYSQLTGMGVSNYGIKKTLPRLIVAAVLVNLSFFVCQLAVDITQIIGGSINGFLQNIPVNGANTAVSTWQEILGPVLAGTLVLGGAAIGAAVLALSISIPLLLAFLVAVVMTVIILVGREAAIVILIILSPLAFVAYLLPNTEKWFKRWYQMFGTLLMVYPIIALLYGGGALASKIIANAGSSAGDGGSMDGFALGLTAIAVSAIPLIMTPTILKNAMNSTGSVGKWLSSKASKANSRIKPAAMNSRLGEAKQGLQNRFALRRAESRAKSRFQQGVDNSSAGKFLGLNKGGARALSALDAEEDKEVQAAMTQIAHQTSSTNRIGESARILKEAIVSDDLVQARAAQRTLLGSGNAGISALQEVYEGTGDDELSQKASSSMADPNRGKLMGYLRSEVNSSGLKGKNNALARWGYDAKVGPSEIGRLTDKNDALSSETFTKLNSVELAGQSAGNLKKGEDHITSTMAQAVLDNSQASALLDGTKREFFVKRAQGGGGLSGAAPSTGVSTGTGTPQTSTAASSPASSSASASTSAPTVAQSPTGQQAGAGPGAPSAGASSAAQRARETAQKAEQGTKGTTPYIADTKGTITQQASSAPKPNPVLNIPHTPPAAPPQPPSNPNPPTPPNPGNTPPPAPR